MRRGETTNTFTEGMVSDINPLVTPNNILTNALNATLITMNGNENVLQNDMGNSKVDTAFLPTGYVPVGMKEHGGIIYVASHNPITKKSQIGSFPSPQQLFNGDDLNVKPININFNNFIENRGSIPYIKAEYYKEKLFVDTNTGVARKFYPGDKFIITTEFIDQEIIDAVNAGIVSFKLGVVTSSGNLDYIDDSKLRIYSEDKGFWIFCYQRDQIIEEILKDPNLVQIYNAKTSGELVLVVEYKTIQAFNLIRQYSFDNNLKTVKLFGKIDSYTEDISGYTNSNSNIGLIEDNSYTVQDEITLQGTNDKQSYSISPVSIYGVLERLKKIGTIDFSLIKPNAEYSTEWRYFITDSYIKIGWSYDYYNVDIDKQLSKIQFTFIDFRKSDQALDSLTGYSVDLIKDYYNGNFEEVFSFGSSGIMQNYIYIVRIDRYVVNSQGVETKLPDPFYRLLYTGTIFNDYYSTEFNFNNLASKQEVIPFNLNINTTIQKPNDYQYSQRIGTSTSYLDVSYLNSSNFKTQLSSSNVDVSSYRYGVKKRGTYKIVSVVDAEFNYSDAYAGYPKEDELQNYIRNNISASLSDVDNSNVSYSTQQSQLVNELALSTNKSDVTFEQTSGNIGQFTAEVTIDRNILSNAGPIREDSYEFRGLSPLYSAEMSLADRNKLIGFTSVDGGVRCLLGTEDKIDYNGTLKDNGETITGTGVESGDDPALSTGNINMGNPCVNIMAGRKGQDASLGFEGANFRRRSPQQLNGWAYAEDINEVDRSDNFILATWRTDAEDVKFINLGSRRTETRTIGRSSIIRVDLMLKCYLSQMLIVKDIKYTGYTVGANSSNYVFHNSFNSKVNMQFNIQEQSQEVDFYLLGDTKSIKQRMREWSDKIEGLNDYLPTFVINTSENVSEELEFGDEINFVSDTNVMNCFLNAYSQNQLLSTNYDETKIYIGKTTGVANSDGIMPLEKDSDGLYVPSSSFTSIKDWYNRSATLSKDINSMFVLTDNKEILVRKGNEYNGIWYQNKDSHAPNIVPDIYFGNTKLFDY